MKARCIGCIVVAVGQALDGADGFAGGLHRKHQAGAHRLAVDDHRAGAADAVFAADMGSGLPAFLADRVRQGASRLDANGIVAAVDVEGDVGLAAHVGFSAAAQRRANPLRRRRHLVDRHAEWRQRIVDGVDHRRRRADGAAFAQSLGLGDRVAGERLDMMQLDRREFRGRSAAENPPACWSGCCRSRRR